MSEKRFPNQEPDDTITVRRGYDGLEVTGLRKDEEDLILKLKEMEDNGDN